MSGPLYGPDTYSWRTFREWPFLLGGMRALLMQLAEPKVAAGVADHSDFQADTFSRLHRTMAAMWEIGVGTPEQARRALERIRRVHDRVHGLTPAGEPYDAHDPELLLWVFATLVDTVLVFEERYLDELSPAGRERYYRESLALARAFAIPEGLLPADLAGFRAYVEDRVATLEVSLQARRLAHWVLHPQVPFVPDFLYGPFRIVTADLLPERLRRSFGLPWGRPQRAVVALLRTASRRVLPQLPTAVRRLPVLEVAAAVHRRLDA